MSEKEEVVVYTTQSCGPCEELKQKILDGDVDRPVALVDIESEDGFKEFSDLVLSHSDGAIPSAFLKGKQCEILISEADTIIIRCPDDPPDEDEEGGS